MSRVPCVCVVGWSDAGKTTLLERLVPVLKARGLRVAVLKHSAHPHTLHRPGSDTARLESAGAYATGLATPQGLQLTLPGDAGALLAQLLPGAEGLLDLVLVEGWKDGPYPKLEVWRAGLARPLATTRTDIGLVVSEGAPPADMPPGLPTLEPVQLEDICAWVLTAAARS